MGRKKIKSAKKVAGLSPGTLVYVGSDNTLTQQLRALFYAFDSHQLSKPNSSDEISNNITSGKKLWLDCAGVGNLDAISNIGEKFKLHPLTLEDIVNTSHRPKLDDFDDYIFLIVKTIDFDTNSLNFQVQQVALVLGENFLLSFHDQELTLLEPIYQRLESGRGRIRKLPIDYLAYAILDAVVDNYFIAFEKLDLQLEALHKKIHDRTDSESLNKIHQLKNELQLLRHDLIPLRELIGGVIASDSELLHPEVTPFFKDLNDHVVHAISELESARFNLSELTQYSMMILSNQVAEVTKLLTLLASFFIPLTFIVGIYGMNFRHMPELEWRYGYLLVWLLMIGLSSGLYYYFKKKRWL